MRALHSSYATTEQFKPSVKYEFVFQRFLIFFIPYLYLYLHLQVAKESLLKDLKCKHSSISAAVLKSVCVKCTVSMYSAKVHA